MTDDIDADLQRELTALIEPLDADRAQRMADEATLGTPRRRPWVTPLAAAATVVLMAGGSTYLATGRPAGAPTAGVSAAPTSPASATTTVSSRPTPGSHQGCSAGLGARLLTAEDALKGGVLRFENGDGTASVYSVSKSAPGTKLFCVAETNAGGKWARYYLVPLITPSRAPSSH